MGLKQLKGISNQSSGRLKLQPPRALASNSILPAEAVNDPYFSTNPQYLPIEFNNAPTWSTAGGSLGSFSTADGAITPIQLVATDLDAHDTVTFSVTTGSLPTGLSMDSAGLITGTPTVVETQTFTVQATDGKDNSFREFSIEITAPALPSGTFLERIGPYNFTGGNYLNLGSIAKRTNASISVWIKTTRAFANTGGGYSSSSNPIFACDNGGWNNLDTIFALSRGNTLSWSSGHPGLEIHGPSTGVNGSVASSVSVTNGQWRHIVVTCAGTAKKIYVDNVQRGSATTSQSGMFNSSTGYLCASTAGGLFGGYMEMRAFRMYSHTLNTTEIAQLYGEY